VGFETRPFVPTTENARPLELKENMSFCKPIAQYDLEGNLINRRQYEVFMKRINNFIMPILFFNRFITMIINKH
jgi:hypothetical protein